MKLADEVHQLALQLVQDNGGRRIKLYQLYQQIPELKAKLSKLDRLPLTRAAIVVALKRIG